MNARACKIALTSGTEIILASMREQLAHRVEGLQLGLTDGLFSDAQTAEAQKNLAHLEGEIRGIETHLHFVQKLLDIIIEHEAFWQNC